MTASEAAPPRKGRRTRKPASAGPEGLIEAIGVQRRAPSGDNPAVGIRGTRTQQRILLAALEVFGEVGYHACRVEAITAAAGCSRPSFYQYFSSKEDLFRQLAGVVAREQFHIADEMGTITPDAAGLSNLRAWLEARAAIYETYRPVFAAFAAAADSDDVMASGAARVESRSKRMLERRVDPVAFESYEPTAVYLLLSNGVSRAIRLREFLLAAAPERAPERARMLDALAEVLHRALFGRGAGRLVEPQPRSSVRRAGRVPVGAAATPPALGPSALATFTKLLDAAATTFVSFGYHDARVDDIVAAAGTSHGTFYHYFGNKDEVFRAVAARTGQRLFNVLLDIPNVSDGPSSVEATGRLRAWITEYSEVWRRDGPIFRLWIEQVEADERLAAITARALDRVQHAFRTFLAHRDFGDLELDAFLLIPLLDLDPPGSGQPPAGSEAMLLQVVRRGFLGIDDRR